MKSEELKNQEYKYGFTTEIENFKAPKGLSKELVEEISKMKNEPKWMLDFRLKALDIFLKKPLPTWGGDLDEIDFDNIHYYLKPQDREKTKWEDVPEEIKDIPAETTPEMDLLIEQYS